MLWGRAPLTPGPKARFLSLSAVAGFSRFVAALTSEAGQTLDERILDLGHETEDLLALLIGDAGAEDIRHLMAIEVLRMRRTGGEDIEDELGGALFRGHARIIDSMSRT